MGLNIGSTRVFDEIRDPKISITLRCYVSYFTGYNTHFFLGKIASKILVRLILEINIKMSSI